MHACEHTPVNAPLALLYNENGYAAYSMLILYSAFNNGHYYKALIHLPNICVGLHCQ